VFVGKPDFSSLSKAWKISNILFGGGITTLILIVYLLVLNSQYAMGYISNP
jgi:hypothetical protein